MISFDSLIASWWGNWRKLPLTCDSSRGNGQYGPCPSTLVGEIRPSLSDLRGSDRGILAADGDLTERAFFCENFWIMQWRNMIYNRSFFISLIYWWYTKFLLRFSAVSVMLKLLEVHLLMLLTVISKPDLCKIWDEVFSSVAVPAHQGEMLAKLRPKYCPGRWQMHGFEQWDVSHCLFLVLLLPIMKCNTP